MEMVTKDLSDCKEDDPAHDDNLIHAFIQLTLA